MKVKIGLVGYYGWGNYGDEMFARCLAEYFPEFEFCYLHDAEAGAFRADFVSQLEAVSAIIIGGGDLIIPWYLSWLYWDPRLLSKPVFIYGVGVPTWGGRDESVMAALKAFFAHPSVKLVSCRDRASADWVVANLTPAVPVQTAPDIVCSYRGHLRSTLGDGSICFISRANNPVGQPVVKAIQELASGGYRIKHLLLGTNATLTADSPTLSELGNTPRDIAIRSTEDELLSALQSSRLVLSTKFHGCVSAYMSGVPSISLSTADKFVAFYEDIDCSDSLVGLEGKRIEQVIYDLLIKGMDFRHRQRLYDQARIGLDQLRSSIEAVVDTATP